MVNCVKTLGTSLFTKKFYTENRRGNKSPDIYYKKVYYYSY